MEQGENKFYNINDAVDYAEKNYKDYEIRYENSIFIVRELNGKEV